MAAETPVSVAVRRVARADPEVRAALFGDRSRLPMVFQYNPLIHLMETNADAEIVTTISRLDLLAPRIRYNVHDEGGTARYARVRQVLAGLGYRLDRLGEHHLAHGPRGPLPWTEAVPLPFLWIFGRRDATISIMGANIYPEDVESAIYADPDLAAMVHSFQLTVHTDESGTPRPGVHGTPFASRRARSSGSSVSRTCSRRLVTSVKAVSAISSDCRCMGVGP